jgi:GntR family transcriptional regulator
MNILLSNSSADPIYLQIVKQIKHQIIAGDLAEGNALPSIRKLALDLQISVITTKRAYEDLEKEGMINSIPGRGMFVAAQNLELMREKKMKLVEDKLAEAVGVARIHSITRQDLIEMLDILFEDK